MSQSVTGTDKDADADADSDRSNGFTPMIHVWCPCSETTSW